MSSNCYSGNFSSCSLGGSLHYRGSPCGLSYPSNLVYTSDFCSPSTCQLGSSLYSGCQEPCGEPSRCQTSYVASRPCQTSCYRPRISIPCSPCDVNYTGSLGFGSRSSCSLRYGSRRCYPPVCGSSRFRPLGYGICGFPSLGYGSGLCHPTYLASRTCQSSCYRPVCGFGFY
ncbi:keratin-associated protein 13-1-like [Dasypus novemcinctus]|uniref:keratin-associated protein 13-1-like n=1 Tax=Dasypus novemcinctus TaxID=9361 RepID=UPI000328FA30|nr:keratin-associated protein 13-1-like [Dasypus novemcinctus]